jgi:hypothetical protein
MGKSKQSKNSIGVAEGLLLTIAMTLVIGVGFYALNANKDDQNNTTNSANINAYADDQPLKATPTLDEVARLTKEYYQFKYIDKWGETVSQDQLAKWLTPNLIGMLNENPRADTGISPQASGFTKPDTINVKGISSDSKTATVELAFGYTGNPAGSTYHTITLEATNGTWLISSAQLKQ